MSIIFKALKKLQDQSKREDKDNLRQKDGNIQTLSQVIFSPGLILLFTLLIFIIGAAVLFYIPKISDRNRSPGQKQVMSDNPSVSLKNNKIDESTGVKKKDFFQDNPPSIPPAPPPDVINDYKKAEKDNNFLGLKEYRANENRLSRYLPPASRSKESGSVNTELPSPDKDLPDNSKTLKPTIYQQRDIQFKQQDHDLPVNHTDNGNAAIFQKDSNVSGHRHVPRNMSSMESKVTCPEPVTNKVMQANIDKNKKTDKLVKKIKRAVAVNNKILTQKLIKQLAEIKGGEDTYVLNLMAFWELYSGNYEPAEILLRKVLSTDKKNVEAGYNMAVLEINTGNPEKALNRLTELEKLFPENSMISSLKLKLE